MDTRQRENYTDNDDFGEDDSIVLFGMSKSPAEGAEEYRYVLWN